MLTYCPEHGDMTSEVTTDMTSDECEEHSLTHVELTASEYDDNSFAQAQPIIPLLQPTITRTRTRTIKTPSCYTYVTQDEL